MAHKWDTVRDTICSPYVSTLNHECSTLDSTVCLSREYSYDYCDLYIRQSMRWFVVYNLNTSATQKW